MRRIVLVCTITATAVAASLAVGQPTKGPNPNNGSGSSGSGSAKTGSGSAKIPFVGSAGSGSAKSPGPGSGSAAIPTVGSGSDEEPVPTSDEPEVDSLRQEYLKLRDELFESRARAATVASQLYSTKASFKLTFTSGRMYGVSRAAIRLDGANVYDNTSGAVATDDGIRFEGYIAPGRHVVTFRIEANGKDDPRFTTAVESTVIVEAVAGKDLLVAGKASDGGNMPYQWKKKEQGTYKLGLDVDVRSIKRATEQKASTGKGSGNATASK